MTHAIEELIPDYIRGLPAYIPGRPVEEVERELKIHAIKLASNENPLGPSPMAAEAVKRAVEESNRYPDGGSNLLRKALAARHGVTPEEIFVGLGSSEIIDLAARCLLRPGLAGVTSEGSYAPYSLAIRAAGAELLQAPLRKYTYDLSAIARRVTPQTRIVYLANPNNPTGTAFGGDELDEFLSRTRKDVLIVLDEAYIHYAERPGMPRSEELYRKHGNLLILRTFSKVYGLAGLRIGYGIGPTGLLAAFNRLKTPFNTSGVAQAAALAALEDKEHVRRSVETNRAERRRLIEGLVKLGLQPVPSETNFVFVEMGAQTSRICDELLHRGVIVRPLGWMGFPEAARVSAGRPEENERFLEAISEIWPVFSAKRELAKR
ncbi:MAG TPA: histidinol-phosphate transaminase [Candidatus Acidoferrum sp.]|nr:histidinol-phosphate transaminase [Candidatus Acidoferrum sp.]